MEKGALVSVVVPCYNPKPVLRETLESIRAQTYQPVEIILVNDGSTSAESLELLQSLAAGVDRYIEQPNRGCAAARNAGFRVARGEAVLPLDADDRILPQCLAEFTAALQARPEAAFAYGDYQFFGEMQRVQRASRYNLYRTLDQNGICYASLIRRAAWERACGYNESDVMRLGYEDWDFWLRLAEIGCFGFHLPKVLMEYRKDGRSLFTIALENHDKLVAEIQANHPSLYSWEGRARIKARWEPSVCLVSGSQIRVETGRQTIADVEVAALVGPDAAAVRTRAPALLLPASGCALDAHSAELAALAIWSGKASVTLPDGSEARRTPAGEVRAEALEYLTRPARRRRVALVADHVSGDSVLLDVARSLDRESCETFLIATGGVAEAAAEVWPEAVDHVYDLDPLVVHKHLADVVYWLARNWRFDVLVVHGSEAGESAARYLRDALPALRVVDLASTGAFAPVSDLRLVVPGAARPAFRDWLSKQTIEDLTASPERKTLLAGELGIEDWTRPPTAFGPGPLSAIPALDPAEINFGNVLQVAGLRLLEKGGLLSLEIHWQCLNRCARPVRCFVHVVGEAGNRVTALDHDLPQLGMWQPGDEAYESLQTVLAAGQAPGARVHLGLFDSHGRLQVWTSTVPLVENFTAAALTPNARFMPGVVFQLAPSPLQPCRVEFESDLRLTGYSLDRGSGAAWLRLRWEGGNGGRPQFFGHLVAAKSPDTPILASFDCELRLPEAELCEVVRDISRLDAGRWFLRAGVFDPGRSMQRLAIQSSSLPVSRRENAFYLDLPPERNPR